MTGDVQLDVSVPLAWRWAAKLREDVGVALSGFPDDLREAVVKAASELAENVIKYGEPVASAPAGQVSLSIQGGLIRLDSRNGVISLERYEGVRQHIEHIRTSPNREELYLARLRAMLENPQEPGSGLGLICIALEGGFELSCSYESQILTITAEKKM